MAAIDQDEMKARVAARAIDFVHDGMALGLGTGTTAKFFVEALAARVRDGLAITCVPTSEATRLQAEALGIKTTTLDEVPALDLTIDGADEFDPELRLIKGGGGALLREKIVAAASKALLVIADASKEVERLGRFPLPIEVNVFGLGSTRRLIAEAAKSLGVEGAMELRRKRGSDETFVTDGGHLILDCHFGSIPDPDSLSSRLLAVPGVVEHGLFIGLAKAAIVADGTGTRVVGTLSP